MGTPYIGFGNDTLSSCPPLRDGDEIDCPECGGKHLVEDSDPPMLLFYRCGNESFIAGIKGRSIIGKRADVKGQI